MLMSSIPSLTWLHVSDLHFGHGDAHCRFDQSGVTSQIISNAQKMADRLGPPDVILVTGDVAYSGQPSQYEQARVWLNNLQAAVRGNPLVFLVPGNHDVDRKLAGKTAASAVHRALRAEPEKLDELLYDATEMQSIWPKLGAYTDFAVGYGSPELKPESPFYAQVVPCSLGGKLIIVGLNTALLCFDNDDSPKNLALGRGQLLNAIQQQPQDALLLVLQHHPDEWLSDGKELTAHLQQRAHIQFSGHVHHQQGIVHVPMLGGSRLQFVAGAGHKDKGEEGYHAYSWGQLSEEGLAYYPWVWQPERHAFALAQMLESDDFKHNDHAFVERARLPKSVRSWLPNTPLSAGTSAVSSPAVSIGKTPAVQGATEQEPPKQIVTNVKNDSSDELSKACHIDLFSSSDPPPVCQSWIGRKTELTLISSSSASVIAITGIGGQGKSTLAAKTLELGTQSGTYVQWDWRDLREEDNTFQKQLLSIIARVTKGRLQPSMIANETVEYQAKCLFNELGQEPWIFVLDNVDHYINVDKGIALTGLHAIIKLALTWQHKARFIITCRPRVDYESENFLQIRLGGLSADETIELLMARGVKHPKLDEAHQLSKVTEGHPLWINLMATQVAADKATLKELIVKFQHGMVDGLPREMLRSIWTSLNENQRTLLRCMAELVRAVPADKIFSFFEKRLKTNNRFIKSLRTLKAQNLIIEKSSPNLQNTVELHPVIREFIRREYSTIQRRDYIATVVEFFDRLIIHLRPQIKTSISETTLEHWLDKAELEANMGQYEASMKTLTEIVKYLELRGFGEEYLRIALKILMNIDWALPCLLEHNGTYFVERTVEILEFTRGRSAEADQLLERYGRIVPDNSASYIGYCVMQAFAHWHREEHDVAVEWAEKGHQLKSKHSIDTRFDCAHILALANRDTKKPQNIDSALLFFQNGISLDLICKGQIPDNLQQGHFYGNIGRCLFFKGDYENALSCYIRSALLLEKEAPFIGEYIGNAGYASLWIGQLLEMKNDISTAYLFYRRAYDQWMGVKPALAERLSDQIQACGLKVALELVDLKSRAIEKRCRQWLDSHK